MDGEIVGSLRWLAVVTLLVTLLGIAGAPLSVGQTMQTVQVMRQKLAHSEQLLAALVTSDWAALDEHSRRLQGLTNDPGWDVMRLPEFHKYTTDFQRANQALIESAGDRDQRTALTAYNGVVASCVECHRYVARARIAQRVVRSR